MEVQPIIEVVPYDPNWPRAFEEEAKKLEGILGPHSVKIYHIGSTAVPGLSAKPIIDIMVVVKDILEVDELIEQFEELGYEAKGEYGMPFRRYFQKGEQKRTHHIHIFEEGSGEVERHLHFRDYLRTSSEALTEYESLKLFLAKEHSQNRNAYTEGKEAFVKQIDKKYATKKLRLICALTQSEWDAVDAFRKKATAKDILNKDSHTHILLFQGINPIGYADIAFASTDIALLALFYMEAGYEPYRDEFMSMLNRWIHHKGRYIPG